MPKSPSRACSLLSWLLPALLSALILPVARGQTSPMLYTETITVSTGGPLEFTFRDEGTGATNYIAEFTAALGNGALWTADPAATITSLGNGAYRIHVADPIQPNGFYRILALRPSGGTVIASFAATQFQVSEGGAVSAVIHFSAPYTGVIRYTVTGTVGADDFQPLSGEVQVNNSMTASIAITLTDNTSLDELRYLALRLERGPGFELGSAVEASVMIDENDAEWRGALSFGAAALGFVLSIEETSNGVSARLRSDPAGIFPLAPSDSTLVFTENSFESTTANIPLDAESNLFGTAAALTVQLNAENGVGNQLVSSNSVEGAAILITEYAGKPYLNRTNLGSFHLYKPPVRPSAQPVELVHAQ